MTDPWLGRMSGWIANVPAFVRYSYLWVWHTHVTGVTGYSLVRNIVVRVRFPAADVS